MKKQKHIEPIQKIPSVTEKILERMLKLITDGTFLPGEKLPGEKELSKRLKVSRPSLREALNTLQARGLLEIKPRSGTYIKSAIGQHLSSPIEQMLAFEPSKMWELMELRKILDTAAAEMAAARHSAPEASHLKQLIDSVQVSLNQRTPSEEDIEIKYGRFFKQIALLSHNTLFIHMYESISDVARKALPFSRIKIERIPGAKAAILDQLYNILDAIRIRDAQKARELVQLHIDFIEQSLRSVIDDPIASHEIQALASNSLN